jgi:hypothetical protein
MNRLMIARTGPLVELGWWTFKRGYLLWKIRPRLEMPRWQHRLPRTAVTRKDTPT